MAQTWKKGRGKLGLISPLVGDWVAEADSPRGPMRCARRIGPILGGKWLAMDVRWEFGSEESSSAYEEHAVIGSDSCGDVRFWSFTSDGKRSEGTLSDATDLHPEAIAFEASMPAGLARMAYWPTEDGFAFVVEAKTQKGWSRMVDHRYRPA